MNIAQVAESGELLHHLKTFKAGLAALGKATSLNNIDIQTEPYGTVYLRGKWLSHEAIVALLKNLIALEIGHVEQKLRNLGIELTTEK